MKIQLFVHLLDEKVSLVKVSNAISVKNLTKYLTKKFKLKGDIIIKTTTNLLKKDITLLENNVKNNDDIYVLTKVKGGIVDVIVKLLTAIVALFKNLGGLITDLIGIIMNILELIPQVFSPDKLINDIIYGIIKGITSMLSTLMGGINRRPKKSDDNLDGGSQLFGSSKRARVVCIKPSTMTLIMLILCPPLALLLTEGIKAWYMVIICALMTYYLYYIPGFIFAALHILC